MRQKHLLRVIALLSCLLTTMSIVADEAYAEFNNGVLRFYCDNSRSRRTGTTYDLNEGSNYPEWHNDSVCSQVTGAIFSSSFVDARPTTTFAWFADMPQLWYISNNENFLNTSEVTNMASMFSGCTKLKELDLHKFNTLKVTDMDNMFSGCSTLKDLNLSEFFTPNLTSMEGIFNGCSKL